MHEEKSVTVLLVEPEEARRERVRGSLERSGHVFDLRCVGGGSEMWDYLRRRGRFTDPADAPRPGLILLGAGLGPRVRADETRRLGANLTARLIPVAVLRAEGGAEEAGARGEATPPFAAAEGSAGELLTELEATLAVA